MPFVGGNLHALVLGERKEAQGGKGGQAPFHSNSGTVSTWWVAPGRPPPERLSPGPGCTCLPELPSLERGPSLYQTHGTVSVTMTSSRPF